MCGPAKTICSTLCYLNPEGRWVHVEGNPVAGNNWGYGCKSLCAKGNSAMQTLYNPARLEYPMKRVGEKGEGKFERCTWEEALEGIAAKLLENREKYGPWSYAALSPQQCNFISSIGRRFMYVYGSPNYLHSAICQNQITVSRHLSIGKKTDCYPYQLGKTKLLVNWGVNGENADVNNTNDKANPYRRFDAMEQGLEFIDVRPMLDPLAAHASEWVPVRPGTDAALALAFLNVIIEEDLYDHDFCENWCNGFDKLAEHVKQFPPSWAAPITGISEEQIVHVARRIGTEKPDGRYVRQRRRRPGERRKLAEHLPQPACGHYGESGCAGRRWRGQEDARPAFRYQQDRQDQAAHGEAARVSRGRRERLGPERVEARCP